MPLTLPALIELEQHGGDWAVYLDAVYQLFRRDFIDSKAVFRRYRIGVKRHPIEDGKEATFWHLISSGKDEASRIPDLRRCERIAWPRTIIDNSVSPKLKVWQNRRKGEDRILILHEAERFLVVLSVRRGYVLLWTAFLVERDHRLKKLLNEYGEFKKAGASTII